MSNREQFEEIEVVGFAGAGGSCEGIKAVTGRSPAIVINHDPIAIAVHTANHPDSMHVCQNIYKAVPIDVLHAYAKAKGLKQLPKIGLAWFSPDCKHHSKAKGGKPLEKNIRDLAWVILAWAKLPAHLRPRLIMVENVEEFADWCPLTTKGRPNKRKKGQTFKRWAHSFERYGYRMEFKDNVVAADKGTPTTRKRLVAIFRNDAQPIIWREGKFAKPTSISVTGGERRPWRTAAEIIDWSLPCPSIFDTAGQIMKKHGLRAQRPLADNTLARVARGVKRYVIDAAEPFIVPITHTGDARVHGLGEPMRTITTAQRGEHALITPFVTKFNGGATGHDLREPLHTVTAAHSETHSGGACPLGLIAPVLCAHYGEGNGGKNRSARADEPIRTITCDPRHSLVTAAVAPMLVNTRNGERKGQQPRVRDITEPCPTVTAQGSQGAVAAVFLAKHYGDTGQRPGSDMREPVSTITACDHNAVVSAGLVSLKGTDRRGATIAAPVPGFTAGGGQIAETRAFLTKFHRDGGQLQDLNDPLATGGTKARFGLIEALAALPPFGPEHMRRARQVAKLMRKYGLWDGGEFVTINIEGVTAVIVDLGMRMLTPNELKLAMGFRPDYIIDRGLFADGWRPVSKTAQVRLVGNAVCPQVAEDAVEANYAPMQVDHRGIPAFALEAAE